MGKNYWEIYKEVWNFHKRFSIVRSDSRYWDEFVEAFRDLRMKYKQDPFVNDLTMAVLEEVERIERQLRNKEEGN